MAQLNWLARLILVASALLLGAANIGAESPKPRPREIAKHPTEYASEHYNDRQSSQDPPAPVAAIGNDLTEQESANTKQKDNNERSIEDTNLWLMRFTGALVVVASLQLITLIKQSLYLKRAAWIEQRAQIVVTPRAQTPIDNLAVGKQPIVYLIITNTGPTPAYSCSYETWIAVVDHPFREWPHACDREKDRAGSVYHDAPQLITIGIELKRALTEQEILDIATHSRKALTFRVYITYHDAFGKKRWADFGFSYTSRGIAPLVQHYNSN